MSRRRWIAVGVAVVALGAASCSSSDPEAFELEHPAGYPEAPFTVAGVAVDSGVLCADGVWVAERFETMEGKEVPVGGWDDILNEAIFASGVAEVMRFVEFRCADGSGMLLVEDHPLIDFSVVDVDTFGTGSLQVSTFEISGTDSYGSLSGSGDAFVDFDGDRIVYVGEATN